MVPFTRIIKWLKSFCCYSSNEVLCCGCMHNLYVDAAVVLTQYFKDFKQ